MKIARGAFSSLAGSGFPFAFITFRSGHQNACARLRSRYAVACRRTHVVRNELSPDQHLLKNAHKGRFLINGGGDEIRTHDRFDPMPAFQASALNRSATPPYIWKRRKLAANATNIKPEIVNACPLSEKRNFC